MGSATGLAYMSTIFIQNVIRHSQTLHKVSLILQELSYRKQIARQLRRHYVEGIYRPKYCSSCGYGRTPPYWCQTTTPAITLVTSTPENFVQNGCPDQGTHNRHTHILSQHLHQRTATYSTRSSSLPLLFCFSFLFFLSFFLILYGAPAMSLTW